MSSLLLMLFSIFSHFRIFYRITGEFQKRLARNVCADLWIVIPAKCGCVFWSISWFKTILQRQQRESGWNTKHIFHTLVTTDVQIVKRAVCIRRRLHDLCYAAHGGVTAVWRRTTEVKTAGETGFHCVTNIRTGISYWQRCDTSHGKGESKILSLIPSFFNFNIKALPSVLILIIADQMLTESLCCSNKYN